MIGLFLRSFIQNIICLTWYTIQLMYKRYKIVMTDYQINDFLLILITQLLLSDFDY